MIADAERAVALAGIMGGEETEIGEGTTEILLEAANFEPNTIFRTSERLRLAHGGLEPLGEGCRSVSRASRQRRLRRELIVELAGAKWVGHADVHAHAARAAGGPLPARARPTP